MGPKQHYYSRMYLRFALQVAWQSLIIMFKSAPVNGLAWLADVWPATFTSTNKTDCNATWRVKMNYALVFNSE